MSNIRIRYITGLSAILLIVASCQAGGGGKHNYIPSTTLVTVTGVEACDDVIPSPGGPVYRANFNQQGVENPCAPIKNTDVVLGSGQNEAHITYRDYIETETGTCRNNIVTVLMPDKNIRSLRFYSDDVSRGISLIDSMHWTGPSPDLITSVLVINISHDIMPGQYVFDIGLEINGADYGTVPYTIKVL